MSALREHSSPAIAMPVATFEGGWFEMGSDNGAPAEAPRHRHHVAGFAMDRDLVSNRDFVRFVGETGYRSDAEHAGASWGFDGERFADIPGLHWRSFATADRIDHPVVQVSWNDAAAFALWSGKRLPTEAEWEFAARAMAGGDTFAWLKTSDLSAHCGAGRVWDQGPGTSPIGTFDSDAMVRDLVGNVWQWCADDYIANAYAVADDPGIAPDQEGIKAGLKVRRGGAWNVVQAFRLRCSNRGAFSGSRAAPNLGFRCVI